ncbi:hypothetical protein F53441_10458 [Fusarium austroafricanum]|uniref:Heterokaryon incompatibility domain-containing protein n=1 Tax=Fusarium austroafricanum TaxID=2364996 RepID=A0A8H4KAL9_9HYPO|nr:hypothetical protein F53441_10458 [Fusarium austroafricanum]
MGRYPVVIPEALDEAQMVLNQEVVLSAQDPIILHGPYQYTLDVMGGAAAWLRRSGYMQLPQIPKELRNMEIISSLRRTGTNWPLGALMSITQAKFHAFDQRDKVNGLLGLATECQDISAFPNELKPDYSIEVATLYQRVTQFLLRRNGSLAVLSRARGLEGAEKRAKRQHDIKLPSWCPDWSNFSNYNEEISTTLSWIEHSDSSFAEALGFSKQYAASGDMEVGSSHTDKALEKEGVLQLSGFQVDQVKHVHRFDICRSSDEDKTNTLDAQMTPVLKLALSSTRVHDILDWARCLIQSTTANQCPLNGKDENQGFSDGVAWLHGFLERNGDIQSIVANTFGKDAMMTRLHNAVTGGIPEHYAALVRNFCFDRAFIMTRDEKMGIAPSNARSGDTISVLFGGGVPYLARPFGEYWLFGGESYIEGLMAGEAIEDYKKGLVQKETFRFK